MMIDRLFALLGYLLLLCGISACGVEDRPKPAEPVDLVIEGSTATSAAGRFVERDAVALHIDVVSSIHAEPISIAEVQLERLADEPSGVAVLIETEIEGHKILVAGLRRGRYRLKLETHSLVELEREFTVRPGVYNLRMRMRVAELGLVRGRIRFEGVPVEERPNALIVHYECSAVARWVIGGMRRAVAMHSVDLRLTDQFVLEVPDAEARLRVHVVDPNWRGDVETISSPGSPRNVELVVRRR